MFRRKSQRRRRRPARSRQVRLEKLEQRQLLAATPLGVTPMDTGEFLLGSVGVTPVLFESNGLVDPESQNWTAEEIDQTLAKVSEGVNWWSDMLDTLGTVHSLDFVIDDTFAVAPVETPYEPIDRSSTAFDKYIGDFVTTQGYGDADSIEDAVQQFNHAQREKLGTDWAFTIFIVDSSDDGDGLFASGGSFAAAFAYAGGLFLVTPSTRPASTIAHEMGHIFWARDEYSGGGSWTDRRGYYDTQNLNAADNPTPGFQQQISIMRGGVPLGEAFQTYVSPESTLAMVGWRDSDGDGIFDLADVPLSLDAVGYFDAESGLYHFQGSASAVPLMNQNSSGTQSDITLNRVGQLQYSLDGGPWIVAAEPDQQRVEFDLSVAIDQPFSTISWRAIDPSIGVVSPIVEGTSTLPALSASSVTGLAFLDENSDGQPDAGESTLTGTEVVIRHSNGSPLLAGKVDPAEFTEGALPGDLAGVTLAADGIVFGSQVGSFLSEGAGDQKVFHAFNTQRKKWLDRWSSRVALEASFDSSVGEVRIDAIGLGDASFARVEAYDASGQILGRVTSQALADGERATVEVTDSLGRIKSVRVFGHAGSSAALSDLRFGFGERIVTDESGAWQIQNLPDGNYIVDLIPPRVIHQFAQSSIPMEVIAGRSDLIVAAASRVDSPRYNETLPGDVNHDGVVSSRDALVVINDLSRFSSRVLQPSETAGFDVDVSNDGIVSARDALLVINQLGREDGVSGEGWWNGSAPDRPSVTGKSRSVDQMVEPSPPPPSPRLNSAGGTTPDESTGQHTIENADQPPLGRESLAGRTQDVPSSPQQPISPATPEEDNEPESALDSLSSVEPIQLEIPEPFVKSVV